MYREYDWIVKGGEELRVDQRVEMLLTVMNGLLQKDTAATAHHLQVCTSLLPYASKLMQEGPSTPRDHRLGSCTAQPCMSSLSCILQCFEYVGMQCVPAVREVYSICACVESTARGLHMVQVRTYDVVPMNESLGMVAFVPGTLPLFSVIKQSRLISKEVQPTNKTRLR